MNLADSRRAQDKARREIGEETFAMHVKAHRLPEPKRQYRFCGRLWKIDFAWPEHKVALEIDGGIWMKKGAHNTGSAILRDIEKHNALTLAGWRCFRATTCMVKSGRAVAMMKGVLS